LYSAEVSRRIRAQI